MANYKNQVRINLPQDNFEIINHKDKVNESFLRSTKWEPILDIMSVLSGNEFAMYMYIMKWRGKGYYDFSPADLEIELGLSENTSRKIRDRLIELKILVPVEGKNRAYNFIPYPEDIKGFAAISREQRRLAREARGK